MAKKMCPYCGLPVTYEQVVDEEAREISADTFAHDECISTDFEARRKAAEKERQELSAWVRELLADTAALGQEEKE